MSAQLPLDPRTVHAADLRRRIAAGAPLTGIATVTYAALDPREVVDCRLDLELYAITGRQLHPRRRATRTMTLRLRDVVVCELPVCGQCGIADVVVVERARMRSRGEL